MPDSAEGTAAALSRRGSEVSVSDGERRNPSRAAEGRLRIITEEYKCGEASPGAERRRSPCAVAPHRRRCGGHAAGDNVELGITQFDRFTKQLFHYTLPCLDASVWMRAIPVETARPPEARDASLP
jgi:hypothetical protein